jgi:hypothetical protein
MQRTSVNWAKFNDEQKKAWTKDYTWSRPFIPAPESLPVGWKLLRMDAVGYGYAAEYWDGMSVIITADYEQDGRPWLHVSFARRSKMPTYADMVRVKEVFVGDGRECYMVFPAKENHVNIHPNCLHLWCCLDAERYLPDFTRQSGSI